MRRQVIENAYYAGGARFPPSTVGVLSTVFGIATVQFCCHSHHCGSPNRFSYSSMNTERATTSSGVVRLNFLLRLMQRSPINPLKY